ncbi:Heat shock protein 70 [Thiorhodovibrio winogradskyi]|uniref:Heat shock protein 70 n=1 Tax=Thiorhodovibrio winogradskyi TaxID=77007 RepID=A0ABZ0S992_9GAMM|nr:Hsp70 family protein [Thiorhodovibrio winogradskyi]
MRFQAALERAAQRAKETLSAADSAHIVVPGLLRDADDYLVDVEETVTRALYETMIQPLVTRSIELTRKALKEASLDTEDVDYVLMAGGSSMVPLVQQAMEELFGSDKLLRKMHPKHCVAMGAALVAVRIGERLVCPDTGKVQRGGNTSQLATLFANARGRAKEARQQRLKRWESRGAGTSGRNSSKARGARKSTRNKTGTTGNTDTVAESLEPDVLTVVAILAIPAGILSALHHMGWHWILAVFLGFIGVGIWAALFMKQRETHEGAHPAISFLGIALSVGMMFNLNLMDWLGFKQATRAGADPMAAGVSQHDDSMDAFLEQAERGRTQGRSRQADSDLAAAEYLANAFRLDLPEPVPTSDDPASAKTNATTRSPRSTQVLKSAAETTESAELADFEMLQASRLQNLESRLAKIEAHLQAGALSSPKMVFFTFSDSEQGDFRVRELAERTLEKHLIVVSRLGTSIRSSLPPETDFVP